jgi:hemerythrin-like domain-containing protein
MSTTSRSRPERPAAPPLPEFEALDRAHLAALVMLQDFERLLLRLDNEGADEVAADSAKAIMAFFNGPGAQHHADEEKHVFPMLLAGPDASLVQHVRRLQQDHGWIEEDWRELKPQVEAIAAGYNWYDLPMLRAALPIFTALYQDHIALEESLIYPAAKRHKQALEGGQSTRSSTS